jgi:hypothetical protein
LLGASGSTAVAWLRMLAAVAWCGVSDPRAPCAFSSFPSRPPADAVFGRPGQGVSLQSGETDKAGEQVACVDPTTLGDSASGTGSPADTLEPYAPTTTQLGLKEKVRTPWVTYPDLYRARCEQSDGAGWLQISASPHAGARPVVSAAVQKGEVDTGPTWGYHGYEYGLTLGNLLTDVATDEAAWAAHRG